MNWKCSFGEDNPAGPAITILAYTNRATNNLNLTSYYYAVRIEHRYDNSILEYDYLSLCCTRHFLP